jgi:hypothetical protein
MACEMEACAVLGITATVCQRLRAQENVLPAASQEKPLMTHIGN